MLNLAKLLNTLFAYRLRVLVPKLGSESGAVAFHFTLQCVLHNLVQLELDLQLLVVCCSSLLDEGDGASCFSLRTWGEWSMSNTV